jgi:hypothetical protein
VASGLAVLEKLLRGCPEVAPQCFVAGFIPIAYDIESPRWITAGSRIPGNGRFREVTEGHEGSAI